MLQQTLDPVCGMEIADGSAVASTVIEGRRFYFCCSRCEAAFLDTPHRFVGWADDSADLFRPAVVTRTSPGLDHCQFAD